MQLTQIIQHNEIALYARDMSIHMDEGKVNSFIREAENIDLKPTLGYLIEEIKQNPSDYTILLEGGEYEVNGEKKVLVGLKAALAYYTYSRIIKSGDLNIARFGAVYKEVNESSRPTEKERTIASNEAYSVANRYLQECVEYLGNGCGAKRSIKSNRVIFKVLGD